MKKLLPKYTYFFIVLPGAMANFSYAPTLSESDAQNFLHVAVETGVLPDLRLERKNPLTPKGPFHSEKSFLRAGY